MKRLLLSLPVVLILVNSCKKDGCNDPLAFNYDPEGTSADRCIYEPLQVWLEVSPYFGNDAFVAGQQYQTADGRKIVVNHYGLYLSEISFEENTDYNRWTNDVMLLTDIDRDHTGLYVRKSAPTALRFVVGVDSSVYTSDPTDTSKVPETSPLAPQNPSMWWGWAAGYRYILLSGSVDTSATKDGSAMAAFEYHIGLTPNLRTVTFDSLDLQATGNRMEISLRFDLGRMFENIDFTTELTTHTDDNPELAAKIADNVLNAFRIK